MATLLAATALVLVAAGIGLLTYAEHRHRTDAVALDRPAWLAFAGFACLMVGMTVACLTARAIHGAG